jgi:hypothetical protein
VFIYPPGGLPEIRRDVRLHLPKETPRESESPRRVYDLSR